VLPQIRPATAALGSGLTGATPNYGKVPGMDQAAGEVEAALAPLWRLMSFLRLRLYQKADVMQKMGRGTGTDSMLPAQLHWLRVSERAG
jgi:hypothetical protein